MCQSRDVTGRSEIKYSYTSSVCSTGVRTVGLLAQVATVPESVIESRW